MKRLWFVILCVVVLGLTGVGTSSAEREPSTCVFSGVERLWFVNGLFPDSGYAGCAFRELSADLPDSVFGDGSPATDTTIVLGRVSTAKHNGVLHFDLSSIPDSAVITEAKLYLKLIATAGTSSNRMERLSFPRLLMPFNSRATYNTRWGFGGDPASDSAWVSVEPLSADTTGSGAIFGGSSQTVSTANRSYQVVTGKVVATLAGALNYSLSDSVYDGRFSGGTVRSVPTVSATETSFSLGGGSLGAPGWIGVDVTRDVRNWHTGAWANDGWKMVWGGVNGLYWTVCGDCASLNNRPRLLVTYLYAEAATTTVRRVVVAGME